MESKKQISTEEIDALLKDYTGNFEYLEHKVFPSNENLPQREPTEEEIQFENIQNEIKNAISKISISFLNLPYRVDIIANKLWIQCEFRTHTSIIYEIMCTETYYKENRITDNDAIHGVYSSRETEFAIGYIDIHNSFNDYFQLFIRAQVPEVFYDKNSTDGSNSYVFDFLNKVIELLNIKSDITYDISIRAGNDRLGIMNRKDILT